jgi:hypothetical protein
VRKRSAIVVVLCVAAVVGALAATALTLGDPAVPGGGRNGHAEVRLGARQFRISGDAIRILSPGRSSAIDVTFTNPRDRGLKVTRLRVRVRAVEAPNATDRHPCTPLDFRVRQVRPAFAIKVAPHATRSLSESGLRRGAWPRLRMRNRSINQDGCKGASLTLAYRGSGTFRR